MDLNESLLEELAEWFFDPDAPNPNGIKEDKVKVASQCFDQLFLRAPEPIPDSNREASFEEIIRGQFQPPDATILDYHLPYPKFEFLQYLVDKDYLLYGTKRAEVSKLEPREQIDWNGTPVQAVFATRDAFWSMYFAVLNRQALSGSIRNGCFLVEHS